MSNSKNPFLTLQASCDRVNTVAISPDSKYIISGGGSERKSNKEDINIWKLDDGKLVRTLKVHKCKHATCAYDVTCIAVSPNGEYLISGSVDSTVRVWNLKKGKLICVYPNNKHPRIGHNWWGSFRNWDPVGVGSIAFSPDGKYFVTGSYTMVKGSLSPVYLWDLEALLAFPSDILPVKELPRNHKYSVKSVAFSPDGKYFATGSADETIKIWKYEPTVKLFKTLGMDVHGKVFSLAFTPNGKYLVNSSNGIFQNRSFWFWDMVAVCQHEQASIKGENLDFNRRIKKEFSQFVITPNGKNIIGLTKNGKQVEVWDLENDSTVLTLKVPSYVICVAVSPNGNYFVTGSGDGAVRVYKYTP